MTERQYSITMSDVVPANNQPLPGGLDQGSTATAAKRIEALLVSRAPEPGSTEQPNPPVKQPPEGSEPTPQPEGTEQPEGSAQPEGEGEGEALDGTEQPDGSAIPAGITVSDTGEVTVDPAAFTRVVKVDGQEHQVTLADLEKSFSFQSHNTRVAQANAVEKKALAEQQATVREQREQYAKVLPQLESIIAEQIDPYANVDWDKLRAEDPKAFAEHRATYDLQRERLAKVQAERERVETEQREEAMRELAAYNEREHASLLEAIPDWQDATKRTTELAEMDRWAKQTFGVTDEQLGQVNAAWHYVALRKAYLYDKLQANAGKAREKVTQVRKTAAPPAKAGDPQPKPADQRALDTLRQTGKVKDAAAALEARLTARQRQQ